MSRKRIDSPARREFPNVSGAATTVASAFAREGARVFLGDEPSRMSWRWRGDSRRRAGRPMRRVDALDPAQVEKHLEDVMRKHARVDITFNLIGFAGPQGT